MIPTSDQKAWLRCKSYLVPKMGTPRTPDPEVIRPIPWEWVEHPEHGRVARVWSRTFGDWSFHKSWVGLIHEGIDAQLSAREILQRLRDAGHAKGDRRRNLRRLRMYLFTLYDDGYIRLNFGPAPEQFDGRYEVLRELGRGGVGVAWLCHDPQEHRDVVVKHAWDYFQAMSITDPLVRSEVDTLRALQHPNLLSLYDAFEDNNLCHMVREFADGAPLLETLQQRSLNLAALVGGLVDLLEHLHTHGYLLMDLRPANFFVREGEQTAVLIDIGVAQPWTGGTMKLERALGSPGFSAPECRIRAEASEASDVFGLGRLLFSVLSGRPPLATWDNDALSAHLPSTKYAEPIRSMCHPDPGNRPSLDDVRRAFAQAGQIQNTAPLPDHRE